MSVETVRLVAIVGGIIATVCYVAMTAGFFFSGQWQLSGMYFAYIIANIFATLALW